MKVASNSIWHNTAKQKASFPKESAENAGSYKALFKK